MKLPHTPTEINAALDRIGTKSYPQIVEDRALARLHEDMEQMPDVWADLAQRQLARQRGEQVNEQGVHPDAAPSSRDGDSIRFGLALIVILGMASLLMWMVQI